MSAPRRALLGGLVAVPVIAALPTPAKASSAFAATWAAYQPYSDPTVCCGLEDDEVAAWNDRQLLATAALAAAPADNFELETKLAAGLFWFGSSGAGDGMCEEEAALLRSCLADLRAIMAKAAAA